MSLQRWPCLLLLTDAVYSDTYTAVRDDSESKSGSSAKAPKLQRVPYFVLKRVGYSCRCLLDYCVHKRRTWVC